MYKSDNIQLLHKIDTKNSSFEWKNDNEVRITLIKHKDNKVKYWKNLIKNVSQDKKDLTKLPP